MTQLDPGLTKFFKEVHYAYENVPFYRSRLDELGVAVSDVTPESYAQTLPYTAKKEYRKHFPKGVLAKGFALNHPMLNKSQSSGTTGERLITFELGMHLLQRAISCTKFAPTIKAAFQKPERRICRYAAPNCSDVECANPNSSVEDRLLPDNTLVLPVYHDLLTTSDKLIERSIQEIYDFKPDLFYVDPTHFAFLLREFKKRGLTPPKVPVIASYSAATGVSRRQIGEFFPLSTHFGELLSSSEMGWVAFECSQGELHLNESSFFFEFIDANNNATQPGELSELCISSTDQGALPHLRYRTGDMVRWYDEPCSCGHQEKRITMEGRETHFVNTYHGNALSPRQLDRVISAPDWLDLYQLEQRSSQHFTLKMMVNSRFSHNEQQSLLARLTQVLGEDCHLEAIIVDYISAERSGKFQSIKGGMFSHGQPESKTA